MEDILSYIAIGILFCLFLYFGYRDDYNRAPTEFVRTIIGVPLGIIASFFNILPLQTWIKKWIQDKDQSTK